ncbi:MAG: hypothetical protein ACREXR_11100 [Gammaproteobacteria bacterium]
MSVDPQVLHQLEVVVRGPGNMSVLKALTSMAIMPETPEEDRRMLRNMKTVRDFIRDRVTGDLQNAATSVFSEFAEQLSDHVQSRASGRGQLNRGKQR